MIKSVSGRHEDAMGLRSLFLSSCESTSGGSGFSLNGEVVLAFNLLVYTDKLTDVLSRIWALFGVEPGAFEAVSVAAEWTQSDALLLLLASVFFVPGGSLEP